MAEIPGGDFIILGSYYLNGGANSFTFLARVSSVGTIIWTKSFGHSNPTFQVTPNRILTTENNFFIVSLFLYFHPLGLGNGTNFISCDYNGTVLWKKSVESSGGDFGVTISKPTSGGFFYGAQRGNRFMIGNFHSNGVQGWSNNYNNPLSFCSMKDLIEKNNAIYVIGSGNDGQESAFLMKINKSNGDTIWIKRYGTFPDALDFHKIHFEGDSLVVNGITNRNSSNNYKFYQFRLKLDTMGNLGNTLSFRSSDYDAEEQNFISYIPEYNLGLKVSPQTNKYTVTKVSSFNISSLVDTSFSPLYCPAFFKTNSGELVGSIVAEGEGLEALKLRSLLFKSSFQALDSLCDMLPIEDTMMVLPITTKKKGLNPLKDSLILDTSSLVEVSSPNFILTQKCYKSFSCTIQKLVGKDSVCVGEEVVYSSLLTGTCGQTLYYLSSSIGTLITQPNGSVKIHFLNAGQAKLYSSVSTPCGIFQDSLLISSFPSSSSLNLGIDTAICGTISLTLSPPSDYLTYQWQDGSTNSNFQISQPGVYHLTVFDRCGNSKRDSLIISLLPNEVISLGPDRTKCNTDTIHLNAPSGFQSYEWGYNYNLNIITPTKVSVNPLIDTVYYIKAVKGNGCSAYDTVRIKVFHSPSFALGPDLNLCKGDTITFSAPPGFSLYNWNTGSNLQEIKAFSQGTFSIAATTPEGCISRDTVKILNLLPLPIVSLDTITGICEGSTFQLNAGAYASYLWQDGSGLSSYTVSGKGTYHVTVINSNGCKGSDTVVIDKIYSPPLSFLPKDTSICQYGSFELRADKPYKTYLWNDLTTGPFLKINKPGIYSLTVKDQNNCLGKDTIIIGSKECLKGFYIPNAFTPNKDGKNDYFKPLLFGNVSQYQFTIFNRWGEVIFQSKEIGIGWDGKLSGIPQESNVFIFLCTYKLYGEEVKTEKGSFLLIR